ncbi:hypothetical protein BOTBODRAFT_503328 [Botryobasidium botryosum FD-172 SS1]|uniref:Uncharacterized protein n=1 Tax=Botryobasidium botryosum (strain FD-172 SS1) TaxID=930990 RepID=A0A067M5J8_BOTB1|nr:hypothetical protein BOTBODRAFT_503328 [Botryobasidium botryosum FD-172 SS1]
MHLPLVNQARIQPSSGRENFPSLQGSTKQQWANFWILNFAHSCTPALSSRAATSSYLCALQAVPSLSHSRSEKENPARFGKLWMLPHPLPLSIASDVSLRNEKVTEGGACPWYFALSLPKPRPSTCLNLWSESRNGLASYGQYMALKYSSANLMTPSLKFHR